MMRLNIVLLLAVLASAFWLVNVQYQSRRLVTELHRAEGEARRIEIERERLVVEKRAQASPSRVERIAREQLQMRMPTPAITQYVRQGAAPAQGPVPAPPSAAASATKAAAPEGQP